MLGFYVRSGFGVIGIRTECRIYDEVFACMPVPDPDAIGPDNGTMVFLRCRDVATSGGYFSTTKTTKQTVDTSVATNLSLPDSNGNGLPVGSFVAGFHAAGTANMEVKVVCANLTT